MVDFVQAGFELTSVWGIYDSPLAAGPRQSHAGGPGKFDFYYSKGRALWLIIYSFFT